MSLIGIALCLVIGVSDGDTLTARCGEPGTYEQVKVRLSAIDAPEAKQAFGQRSKQALSDLCYQQQATITPVSTDRYGRVVANVECLGQDAGLSQVRGGMAWFYPKYGKGRVDLLRAEREARAGRRGLWVDLGSSVQPVAPWDWRKVYRRLNTGSMASVLPKRMRTPPQNTAQIQNATSSVFSLRGNNNFAPLDNTSSRT